MDTTSHSAVQSPAFVPKNSSSELGKAVPWNHQEQEQEKDEEVQDAEAPPSNGGSIVDAGVVAIRAPLSEDLEYEAGEEEDAEDEEGSFVSEEESYDSALERMAVSSTDAGSPVGSFTALVSIFGTRQEEALMQLNELNSGVSSLDTSLLDTSSEEQFKRRVAEVAERKHLSSDDEVTQNILGALLPLVRGRLKQKGAQAMEEYDSVPGFGEGLRSPRTMPVAKLTVEDVDVDDQGGEEADDEQDEDEIADSHAGDDESGAEVNEFQESEVGRMESLSAGGLLVQGVEDKFPSESVSTSSEVAAELISPSMESSQPETNLQGEEIIASEGNSSARPEVSEESKPEAGKFDDFAAIGTSELPPPEGQPEVNVPDVELGAKKEIVAESVPDTGADGVNGDTGDSAGASSAEGVEDLLLSAAICEPCIMKDRDIDREADSGQQTGANFVDKSDEKQEQVVHVGQVANLLHTEINPGLSLGSNTPAKAELSKVPGFKESQMGAEVVETDKEPGVADEEKTKIEQAHLLAESFSSQQDSTHVEPGTAQRPPKVEKMAGSLEGGGNHVDGDEEEVLMENSGDLSALVHSSKLTANRTDTSPVGGAGISLPARPAGLGRSVPSLDPAPRAAQYPRSSGVTASSTSLPLEDNHLNGDASDGNEETRDKLQMIRVKFLRLAQRLGQNSNNVVVAQVLYRLGLAEQLRGGRSTRTGVFSFERASMIAEEQESAGKEELDFTCTIMLLGKTGVGKSAAINSIFDEEKCRTNAFSPETKRVQEITGTVHGIKLRVIDTPGLRFSFADQRHNEKIMSSVKRFIRKSPPDIVLYFDRLDMQSRDFGDLPLLRTITDTFGAAVWFNAIVVLTHASSAPPDGANGTPLSYEMFVAQRSHVVQQTIRQAAGDMRLMNPVSLVENHPACRTNRAGQRVLPNGQVWKPQLLLLCFASKILAEANSLLKLQDSSPGKPFGARPRVPPLPFLLSSLLQSRAQLKLPDEQGDGDESDDDLSEESDSDGEEDYNELPPFRRLTKDELALLDDEQRKAYVEELDYREKLFLKQQWKEELRRRREMKKRKAAASKAEPQPTEEILEEESATSAAVPVAMPDMALPLSFDSDNPIHRYRCLDTPTQWTIRPVLENHGWDHDSSFDGLNLEKMFIILKKYPASLSGQITKDKKEANLQADCAASFKHGEGKATLAGLDIQTIGKDLAYTVRSETRFSNFRRNKTTGGISVTFLGDTVAAGMKIEDKLLVGRRLKLVLNGGAITGRGDVSYGGSLEATLRGKDYLISHTLSTLGLSIMNWHGDLAIGGNVQSQFLLGKTMITARANLNNRAAGQISIRANSSEQVQMALIGFIPLIRSLMGSHWFSSSQPI